MTWWGRYVGVPYGGEEGEETCWTLVRRVLFEQRGVSLPDYGEIRADDLAAVARGLRDGAEADQWRAVDVPCAFDVVLMRHPQHARVGHVGVMVSGYAVLHVERASASAVVPIDHFAISSRILGFRRHEALA